MGGPTLIRLLARLAQAQAGAPAAALPDQLGAWIDWNRAVALSRALDAPPPDPDTSDATGADTLAAECAHVRAALAQAITEERGLVAAARPAILSAGGALAASAPASGAAALAQYHQKMQRSLAASAARARGRLRTELGLRSPALARLAEVDAAMEAALAPREHTLLAGLPALTRARFDTLAAAAPAGDRQAEAPWHATVRGELRQLLLAELDLRFQPVDALLAALKT